MTNKVVPIVRTKMVLFQLWLSYTSLLWIPGTLLSIHDLNGRQIQDVDLDQHFAGPAGVVSKWRRLGFGFW